MSTKKEEPGFPALVPYEDGGTDLNEVCAGRIRVEEGKYSHAEFTVSDVSSGYLDDKMPFAMTREAALALAGEIRGICEPEQEESP